MKKEIDSKLLCQKWVHSHEEDDGENCVYRTVEFAFPPSRGREEFDLRPDGLVSGQTAGPTDRKQTRNGNWAIEDGMLKMELPTSQRVWKVVELVDDKLILSKQTGLHQKLN